MKTGRIRIKSVKVGLFNVLNIDVTYLFGFYDCLVGNLNDSSIFQHPEFCISPFFRDLSVTVFFPPLGIAHTKGGPLGLIGYQVDLDM